MNFSLPPTEITSAFVEIQSTFKGAQVYLQLNSRFFSGVPFVSNGAPVYLCLSSHIPSAELQSASNESPVYFQLRSRLPLISKTPVWFQGNSSLQYTSNCRIVAVYSVYTIQYTVAASGQVFKQKYIYSSDMIYVWGEFLGCFLW